MSEQLLIHNDPLRYQLVGLNYRSTLDIVSQKEYFLGSGEDIAIQKLVAATLPTKGKLILFISSDVDLGDKYDRNNPGYIKLYLYEGKLYEDFIIGPDVNHGRLSIYK